MFLIIRFVHYLCIYAHFHWLVWCQVIQVQCVFTCFQERGSRLDFIQFCDNLTARLCHAYVRQLLCRHLEGMSFILIQDVFLNMCHYVPISQLNQFSCVPEICCWCQKGRHEFLFFQAIKVGSGSKEKMGFKRSKHLEKKLKVCLHVFGINFIICVMLCSVLV